ncbi:MAG TPA: hypothetical protein VGF18_07310 [Candidatus Tumulicola sp.]|jgi:hypothetical protein
MPFLGVVAMLVAQNFYGSLPIDGVECNPNEGATEHVHISLEMFDRGKRVTVPANIGISDTGSCLYWIHTHDSTGFIHIEAPVVKNFTLGQFFDIWGRDLTWQRAGAVVAPHGSHLSIWVNGAAWHGADPRTIVLRNHGTIVIQSGPPFAKPVKPQWGNL